MDIVLLGVLALTLTLGGGVALGYVRRGRRHRRWRDALREASTRLRGARASAGTRFDGPELRAELHGFTVRLRVTGASDQGVARASVALGEATPPSRLWIGWDVPEAPTDWAHVPEARVTTRAEGTLRARSDDPAFAERAIEGAYLDLVDARREARAHGVTLAVRGGYLHLELRGITTSPHLLERAARAAARIAANLPQWAYSAGRGPEGGAENA
jgi:hypothetical protein